MPSIRNVGQSLPPRLRWYVLATIAIGVPATGVAMGLSVRDHVPPRMVVGIATFFLLTMLAEWRPVPIDPEGKRLVSLAFVFIVSSEILFGWEWAILIGAVGISLAMTLDRAQPIKVAFNGATYAIASGLASLPLLIETPGRQSSYGLVAVAVVVSGAIFVFVNVLLVCGAIGLASGGSIREVFSEHLRHSGPIFGIAVFVAAQAVILWRLSAPLVLLLSAPLFALTLYQRSAVRGRVAEEAASTDSLTGLKNRRAFEDDGAGVLAGNEGLVEAALCLMDIDRFKQVNDRYGHLVGDAVLERLARALDEEVPDRAYRLGGDEFVALMEVGEHMSVIARVQQRFTDGLADVADLTEPVTISAGIALYPDHADDLHTLRKRADMALYRSKYNGRAQISVYGADELDETHLSLGESLGYFRSDSRLLTAHRLVALVDAVADASARERGVLSPTKFSNVLDTWGGRDNNHSRTVASLAVALAQRLGVDGEELEHIHVAALLHDVGKIALPEAVLSKPGPLTEEERSLVERHPIIGFELIRDLGIARAATFVLHHHERWDGRGYPHRLSGAEIPFGSRIILVADAFDALTSDRAYRRGVSVDAAIHEIQSESGRQFDPLIVSALHEHFAHPEPSAEVPTMIKEPAWSFSMSS
jgi:diguanylate cyclase (GGDEF)-like protein/putative nucleotidyltransferase with HDIG domain